LDRAKKSHARPKIKNGKNTDLVKIHRAPKNPNKKQFNIFGFSFVLRSKNKMTIDQKAAQPVARSSPSKKTRGIYATTITPGQEAGQGPQNRLDNLRGQHGAFEKGINTGQEQGIK
jgi:hypothetical protein